MHCKKWIVILTTDSDHNSLPSWLMFQKINFTVWYVGNPVGSNVLNDAEYADRKARVTSCN